MPRIILGQKNSQKTYDLSGAADNIWHQLVLFCLSQKLEFVWDVLRIKKNLSRNIFFYKMKLENVSTGIVRVCSWNLCIYPPIPTHGNKHTVLTHSLYLQAAMRNTLRERRGGRYHLYSVIYFHWHKYLIRSNIKGLSSLKHLKTKLRWFSSIRERTTRKNGKQDK